MTPPSTEPAPPADPDRRASRFAQRVCHVSGSPTVFATIVITGHAACAYGKIELAPHLGVEAEVSRIVGDADDDPPWLTLSIAPSFSRLPIGLVPGQ